MPQHQERKSPTYLGKEFDPTRVDKTVESSRAVQSAIGDLINAEGYVEQAIYICQDRITEYSKDARLFEEEIAINKEALTLFTTVAFNLELNPEAPARIDASFEDEGEPIEERVCLACSVAGCNCDEYDHSEGCED